MCLKVYVTYPGAWTQNFTKSLQVTHKFTFKLIFNNVKIAFHGLIQRAHCIDADAVDKTRESRETSQYEGPEYLVKCIEKRFNWLTPNFVLVFELGEYDVFSLFEGLQINTLKSELIGLRVKQGKFAFYRPVLT